MSKGVVTQHPSSYRQRSYRRSADVASFSFEVRVKESDLWVSGVNPDRKSFVYDRLFYYRSLLEDFLRRYPQWRDSLVPVDVASYPLAPGLARQMMTASKIAGVGPMAAVAGTLAESVGRDLMAFSPELVVENGGDIFLAGSMEYSLAIFAGESPLSGCVGLKLSAAEPFYCGVCTSSAKVGHSLSFGRADALTVVADNTALADAVATAMANQVQKKADLVRVIEKALALDGVTGAVAILGDDLAAGGDLELIEI